MDEVDAKGVPLEGGVASDVRVVQTTDGPVVVKKALPKLKVAADWLSDPARSLIEVAAIQAFTELGPEETVPEIVWVKPEQYCFAMRLVDPRLRNWKSDLLAGNVDLATAQRAGIILGTIHSKSRGRSDIAEQFDDLRFFRELRVEPFFNHVAAQRPELADRINAVAAEMTERRQALVHGDYSPKNILADGGEVVILDFEVAHWGDPRFDIAFCVAHLMLKASLTGGCAERMHAATGAFLDAYREVGLPVIDANLAQVTACLLLARLYGKSPADYLARVDIPAIERKAMALIDADGPPQNSDFFVYPELRP